MVEYAKSNPQASGFRAQERSFWESKGQVLRFLCKKGVVGVAGLRFEALLSILERCHRIAHNYRAVFVLLQWGIERILPRNVTSYLDAVSYHYYCY